MVSAEGEGIEKREFSVPVFVSKMAEAGMFTC